MEGEYSVDDEKNSRIVTNIGGNWCTIIGNTPFPHNTVTSWSIKVHKSKDNDGNGILVGVVPFNINQDERGNCNKCGWYFGCWSSTLYSGLPHNYEWKEYGPRKEVGEYVPNGDSVGVVMDTANGEVSFVLSRVNLAVVYKRISLDKALVPYLNLNKPGDSVKLAI